MLQTAWGWQVAVYLFLGGLGGGMFIFSSVLCLIKRKRYRKTAAACFWVASACVAIGLVMLLLEVIFPLRALVIWQSFINFASWMARGAWGVAIALFVFVCAAFLLTKRTSALLESVWDTFPWLHKRLCTVFMIIGSVLALFVVFYTGALLMSAKGIPFWNSWLLPCLFTVSALVAGASAVLIVAFVMQSAQKLARGRRRLIAFVIIGAAVLESTLLTLYVSGMLEGWLIDSLAQQSAAQASGQMLMSGECALFFWLAVVGGGLVIPLACSIASLFSKGKNGLRIMALGAIFTLSGECALRFLILHVGMHTDYIGAALAIM